MIGRPRSSPNIAVTLLYVAVLIVFVLGIASQTPIAQGPLSYVFEPVQRAVSFVARTFSNFFRGTAELQQLRTENQRLQQQYDALAVQNVRLQEFQAEAVQLRNLLEFRRVNPAISAFGADVIGIGNRSCQDKPQSGHDIGVCAQVIGSDTVPYARYLTLNAGARDGVRRGMPVVSGAFALVGRVGEVSDATCQVQLLIDTASHVNVQLVGTRATGTVDGQSDGSLHLQNILPTDKMVPGDLIVTSGLGGTLPRLLTIGQVDRKISTESATTQEAIVRPAVDFNRIEIVLVISSTTDITLTNPTIVTPTIILDQPLTGTGELSSTGVISPPEVTAP